MCIIAEVTVPKEAVEVETSGFISKVVIDLDKEINIDVKSAKVQSLELVKLESTL